MHLPRPRTLRHATLLASLTSLLLATSVALGGGVPVTTVEAGGYFDFAAPDAGTSTPGAITFGFTGTAEVIAADAELVSPADTNLAFLGGGTPTCLEVTRDSGTITRLAFVAGCTVSGTVTLIEDIFGPGADGYLIADRLAAPAQLLADVPEFATLIGVPASAGTILNVTFAVDVDFGFPETFVGGTSVTGPVTLLAGGDIGVDGASLPTEVIDDASRAALTEAADLGVDATVEITGNGNLQVKSDVPGLEIALDVSYSVPVASVAPSPSPSADLLPDTRVGDAANPGAGGWLALVALLVVALAGISARASALVRRR